MYTKKIPNYVYKIIKVGDKEETKINLNLGNNVVHKMNIQNEGEKVLVSGLLKKECMSNVSSLFYGYLNTSLNKIEDVKIVNYSAEVIKNVEADGFKPVKNQGEGLSPFFVPKYTFKRDNGSIDIVSEYTELAFRNAGNGIHYDYSYGDIVNANIGIDGKVIFTIVQKDQYNIDQDGYLSFYGFTHKNKLILLYNDFKENLNLKSGEKPKMIKQFGFRSSVLAQGIIDEKGILMQQQVEGANQNDYIVRPTLINKINNNLYWLRSTNERMFSYKSKIGFLELK